jgi:hypothetical protein
VFALNFMKLVDFYVGRREVVCLVPPCMICTGLMASTHQAKDVKSFSETGLPIRWIVLSVIQKL